MTELLPTIQMFQAGQSPWLDNISRDLLRSGKLRQMIDEQGLCGVTSNPSIFQKSITTPGAGYEEDIQLFLKKGMKPFDIYDALTISDIQATCDLFLPLYEKTKGEHGFVSLEVLPGLAHDYEVTVSEALRLFKTVARKNVMIKVPATSEGVRAVRYLISRGVNINITLMFSLKHYQDVAEAYLAGLEDLARRGGNLKQVHSVSSVFVSRIDTYVDKHLQTVIAEDLHDSSALEGLVGKAAVANSKLIYQEFRKTFTSPRFKGLKAKGAHVQKLLWGSTSSKNPKYPDLIYVEPLIGKDTVNTMPQATLDAVLHHGKIVADTAEQGLGEAQKVVSTLDKNGINLGQIGELLQKEGLKSFCDAFDLLMSTIEKAYEKGIENKSKEAPSTRVKVSGLSPKTEKAVEGVLAAYQDNNFLKRLVHADPSLWKDEAHHQAVIANRLGWLRVHDWIQSRLFELDCFQDEIKKEKVTDLVLLGMGGSSLAPEVMDLICRKNKKTGIAFHILDTTDPTTVMAVDKKINLKSSLFIVASKSGSTVETRSQYAYFYERVKKAYGSKAKKEQIGKHFIAITDEGSGLEAAARENSFWKIFINPTDIGGRYSALSFFGMVPAAVLGLDVRQILKGARELFEKTTTQSNLKENEAIYVGVVLGVLAKERTDKLMLCASLSLSPFGAWFEQLVAESTGKEGKGIIPVEGSDLTAVAASKGADRAYVAFDLKGRPDAALSKCVSDLKERNLPLIHTEWSDELAVGAAFLFWEIVTAVSSAVLGVNPFDEPNVKESKEITQRLLDQVEKKKEKMTAVSSLKKKADLDALFSRLKEGGFVALLAYTQRTDKLIQAFASVRKKIENRLGVPVLLGFGPRYLHSIGQLYKGGTPSGLFIEFLKKETKDVQVPGKKYTFGQLKLAQAMGDLEALKSKGLPVATFVLSADPSAGVRDFEKLIASAKPKAKPAAKKSKVKKKK